MPYVPSTEVREDGAYLRAAVRLMLAGLSVMLLALLSLYFAPMQWAPFLSLGLYSLLFAAERRLNVASPVTMLMICFYAALAIARVTTDAIAWSVYAAPLVYFVLSALVLGLLAAGRPFTQVYSKGAGSYPVHRAMSIMWGSLHLAAGVSAIALIPNLAFLVVPLGLMVVGAVGTIVLNFFTMGPKYARQRDFKMGKFRFKEVQSKEDHDLFYATISQAYKLDLQSAAGPKRKIDPAKIEAEHRASDKKRDGHTVPFLAFDGDDAIGGICLFVDHAHAGLPIEGEANMSANEYRGRGPVVEMGRLGVMPRYRLERSVLTGLFKCVVEAALERRVHTILNDSFTWQVKLYAKIGFHPITDKPYKSEGSSTGYGLSARPLALDLARMVRLDEQNTTGSAVRDILNDYLVERFFKRLAVAEMFDPLKSKLREIGMPRRAVKEVIHAAE